MGKFTKRLAPGIAALLALSIGASADILIDDFPIPGTNENQLQQYWYYYTNLATKSGTRNEWAGSTGTLTARNYAPCMPSMREEIHIDSSQKKGILGETNYQLLFRSSNGGGRVSGNTGVLEFSNLVAELDPCYPGVGMGTNLTKAPNPDKPVGPDNPAQLPVGETFDGVTHFTFWAKTSHKDIKLKFKVETAEQLRHVEEPNAVPGVSTATSKKLADAAYEATLTFAAEDSWEYFEVAVVTGATGTSNVSTPPVAQVTAGKAVGNLGRATWETNTHFQYTFDIKDAVKIAWFVQGQDWQSPAGEKVRVVIDDVKTKGGDFTPPGICPTCIESAALPTGGLWILSDFDQEVFQPAVGYPYISQNRLGGPWYAYDDKADATKYSATPSRITMGMWNDPQWTVDPDGNNCGPETPSTTTCVQGGAGLNVQGHGDATIIAKGGTLISGMEDMEDYPPGYPVGGNMSNPTNGAFIAFAMGSGWTDPVDNEHIRGYVGIGTKLAEDEDNGIFNAVTGVTGVLPGELNGAVTGIWFRYKTVGMNNLIVSVVDRPALDAANTPAATRSVKIPGTGGLWRGARIPFSVLAPPSWSNWTQPLDLTQLVEVQFSHQADQGIGSIAIDDVYLYGAGIPDPIGVRTVVSHVKNTPLRATYSRGAVNINWNAASKITSGKVSLVNIKGVTVASQPVKASGSKVAARLTTRGALPTGMYFVRIDARDINGKRVVQQVPVNIVK